MRHSSWTLFLVPLALPLILLGFSWAMESLDQAPSRGQERRELVQEAPSVKLEDIAGGTGAGDDSTPEKAEALYK